ncbi:hypothetical protein BKA70DRAFT_1398006 [Coprinopsis sp. MPI-PUGE-AT-0042]|nr:hypothetical protein BKA70DRAFT_1398006 [Coprinopsis sp. MPI-PUGE-AT-0042]
MQLYDEDSCSGYLEVASEIEIVSSKPSQAGHGQSLKTSWNSLRKDEFRRVFAATFCVTFALFTSRPAESGKLPKPQDPNFLTPEQVVDYLLSLDPIFVETQEEMAKETMRKELEFIRSADDVNRSHREELKREAERMQERLNGWEKDGEDMRMKLNRWEEYRAQIATKGELDALVSRHQKELGALQHEVVQHRIDEINQTLAQVRKDHTDLAEKYKTQRSDSHSQVQGSPLPSPMSRAIITVKQSGSCLSSQAKGRILTKRSWPAPKPLSAKRESTIGNLEISLKRSKQEMESARRELREAKSDTEALESWNEELECELEEATSDIAATEGATTYMESGARALHSVKRRYQVDLQQGDEKILRLKQKLEDRRSQRRLNHRGSESSTSEFSFSSSISESGSALRLEKGMSKLEIEWVRTDGFKAKYQRKEEREHCAEPRRQADYGRLEEHVVRREDPENSSGRHLCRKYVLYHFDHFDNHGPKFEKVTQGAAERRYFDARLLEWFRNPSCLPIIG